tara:strand:- start:381 stop:692 length:312 start_codon:yes stop_codon:yes gene_type:complete
LEIDAINSKLLLFFVIVFNLIDAIATATLLHYKRVEEANPLMSQALESGFAFFFFVKFFFVGTGCWILWKYRDNKLAKYGILLCFSIYLVLMLYYCNHLLFLI